MRHDLAPALDVFPAGWKRRLGAGCRFLLGLLILLVFQAAGAGLHRVGVPLPGPVLGLVLFCAALFLRLVPPALVERPAALLLAHMLLFFVPLIVGLTRLVRFVGQHALPLIVALVVSFVAGLLVTAWVLEALGRRGKGAGA